MQNPRNMGLLHRHREHYYDWFRVTGEVGVGSKEKTGKINEWDRESP